MIWGCISGLAGQGPLIIWNKDWGSIKAVGYQEKILPIIESWYKMHPDHILMQDNAPFHSAKSTADAIKEKNLKFIDWPANFPDFNPIENIWCWIKEKLYAQRPKPNVIYREVASDLHQNSPTFKTDFSTTIIQRTM
jgi:DDE superfamily endonuclease